MIASATSEIVAAAITTVGTLGGAYLALRGVVHTVNRQKRPKIVDLDDEAIHIELVRERELRREAEIERDVWKKIALSQGEPE